MERARRELHRALRLPYTRSMKFLRVSFVLVALIGCKDKAPASEPPPADKPAETKPAETKPTETKPAAEAPADKPAGGDGWITYTSKEGKYTIELPTKPKEQAQGGASMVMSEFGATAADDRTAGCGMAVAPVPAKDADPATMLEAMSKGYKTDATILEEKDIKMGTWPGKHLVIQNARHRKWIRLYVIDGKLYINNCGAPFDRGDKEAPTAKRVLESFKLTT